MTPFQLVRAGRFRAMSIKAAADSAFINHEHLCENVGAESVGSASPAPVHSGLTRRTDHMAYRHPKHDSAPPDKTEHSETWRSIGALSRGLAVKTAELMEAADVDQ